MPQVSLAMDARPLDRLASQKTTRAGSPPVLLLIGSGIVASRQIGKAIITNPLIRSVGRAKFHSRVPSTCTAVAVTLLSLLAAAAGAATAQELLIDRPVPPASDPASPQRVGQANPADNPPARSATEVTASGFDPATLLPIESIDAQTDMAVFLQNGVPEKLRLAALRRAWTVDPAIRDFRELQENDWNFNDPNSTPGFGELGPEVDVKRMVAQILGEAPRLALAARR